MVRQQGKPGRGWGTSPSPGDWPFALFNRGFEKGVPSSWSGPYPTQGKRNPGVWHGNVIWFGFQLQKSVENVFLVDF